MRYLLSAVAFDAREATISPTLVAVSGLQSELLALGGAQAYSVQYLLQVLLHRMGWWKRRNVP